MVLGGFLVTSGDPEDIFADFRGYRNRDCGRDRGRDRDRATPGEPKSWHCTMLRVTGSSRGAVNK